MESWATFGGDLHLDLSAGRARGLGLRAALEDALRAAARDGRLAAGTRLPSSRVLAADLGIARNTVAEAYALLTAEGWLTARQGSGTVVAERGTASVTTAPSTPQRTPAVRFDLMLGRPDLALFPRSAWLAAARRALAVAPHEALGYSDPRGRIELRRALADYLARVRGVRTDPERLLICAGYTQGLALLCAALRERGVAAVAVEEYGLPPQQAVITAAGLATVPLPLDEGGARTDLLGGLDAGAAVLTSAHQFPTGVPLRANRRAAAVSWARETGGIVIEDDYDGEFRYDRQPIGAMQALDPERVVYAGTASKSLAPGLRLGWLALPAALVEPVMRQKELADGQSGVMDQLTLAELITSGGFDRHVRRCRLHYRRRRDQLISTLAERAPEVRVTGIAAGLHAVLELPPGSLTDAELLRHAGWLGLSLNTMSGCRADSAGPAPDAPSALVIGYGTPPERAWPGALEALCTLATL
ncbi:MULTISPECIES: PLP-dependent aminotransferase family protein [unclassified Kitasatospora]|uniref:MocR-like pyridoxine biosynthesis transcription factor PdxR n=1 Tax=unclassified Kitasatospora TaxID=2633591 RepID=UPI000709E0E2|nr:MULTISPECIES: PLP-dependent aminotransferase family protein [unclassified Kitasatospora]KQV19783.1 GntR family transcriptional regulator [Kitasatospora sp. Root107]KRB61317.1 GntR family transcriptional regulator [Kitasatospora sp. Root187]